jgi:hypothetical protein
MKLLAEEKLLQKFKIKLFFLKKASLLIFLLILIWHFMNLNK